MFKFFVSFLYVLPFYVFCVVQVPEAVSEFTYLHSQSAANILLPLQDWQYSLKLSNSQSTANIMLPL